MLKVVIQRTKPILVNDKNVLAFVYHDRPKGLFTFQYKGKRFTLAKDEPMDIEPDLTVTYEGAYRANGVKLSFDSPNATIRRCLSYDNHGNPIWYIHPNERTKT